MRRRSTRAEFEAVLSKPAAARYVLRLYVVGMTPKSTRAITNIKAICEEYLRGRYELEVVDVYQAADARPRRANPGGPSAREEAPAAVAHPGGRPVEHRARAARIRPAQKKVAMPLPAVDVNPDERQRHRAPPRRPERAGAARASRRGRRNPARDSGRRGGRVCRPYPARGPSVHAPGGLPSVSRAGGTNERVRRR